MKADKAINALLVETKANDAGDEVFYFQASVGTKDRDGEIVTVDGWQFDNFLKNPVFMTFHDYETWPVGKVVSLEPNAIGFTIGVVFDVEDPEAVKVMRKYQNGFLNCVSVGFLRLETTGKRVGKDWVTTKKELLEVSAVPIPAHPDATMIRKDIEGLEDRVKGNKAVDFATSLALDQARSNLWDRKWVIERALERANDSVMEDGDLDREAKLAAIAGNFEQFGQAMLGWYGDYINVKTLAEAAGVKMVQPTKPSETAGTETTEDQPAETGVKAGRSISKKNAEAISECVSTIEECMSMLGEAKTALSGLVADDKAEGDAGDGKPAAEGDGTPKEDAGATGQKSATDGGEVAVGDDILSALTAFVGNKEAK